MCLLCRVRQSNSHWYKPKVRIQVISTLNHERLTGLIQCRFTKAGYVKPDFVSFNRFDLLVPVDVIETGRGHPGLTHPSSGQRKFYNQLLVSCYLPDAVEDATHVSLLPPASQMIPTTNALPIVFPSPPTAVEETGPFEHEFAICVPIAYNTIDPVMLVSWIEMNRLLGVTVINVYNASLGPAADKVFDHYKDFVVVHQIVPPVPERNFDGTGIGSTAGLNDCMMRNFNRCRYILIIDFDELVVPRRSNVTNYQSVLANGSIKNCPPNLTDVCNKAVHSYAVLNTFFFKHFQPETDYPPHLPYLHYRRRVEHIQKQALGKSFVNPRMCLSAFNHHCYIPLENTFKSKISADDALVHHYRNCRAEKEKHCTYSDTLDDVMLRYEGFLTNSALPVLKQLSLVK